MISYGDYTLRYSKLLPVAEGFATQPSFIDSDIEMMDLKYLNPL